MRVSLARSALVPPARRRNIAPTGALTPRLNARSNAARKCDRTIHSNTVGGYFGIFKRGMKGIYQYCGEQHLHRYLAEYEFRYNHRIANGFDDRQRSSEALKGIAGKRLTHRLAC